MADSVEKTYLAVVRGYSAERADYRLSVTGSNWIK